MSDLIYTPKSSWEIFNGSRDRQAMYNLTDRLLDFLTRCKTERETVAYVLERLAQARLQEGVGPRGGWFHAHGKAVFAFRKGLFPLKRGMHFISAHTDTPRLDFKQRPLIQQAGVGQAKTHYYGGIRKYHWLGRPLAIHGVIVTKTGQIIRVNIGENADDPVFTITDLLPHLAAEQQEKTIGKGFEAEKLNIILGHEPFIEKKGGETADDSAAVRKNMLHILNRLYKVTEEDLISAELQAVPAGSARYVGLDKGLIGAYGIDDRVCVFTALEAFLRANNSGHSLGLILWDKEEIGSEGASGANSRFLEYSLEEVRQVWEKETPLRRIMPVSRALSADVHAGLDPDWQELHEKQNSALLGYGPAFSKFTGARGKVGANDANPEYIGWLRQVMAAKKLPWQMAELGKVDLGGGGTVALFLASFGLSVIDMGPAVLGMHSPFEVASVPDIYATMLAYQAFYEAN